jgi:hypothetical protein
MVVYPIYSDDMTPDFGSGKNDTICLSRFQQQFPKIKIEPHIQITDYTGA